jgi:hypothetical protein
MNDKSNGSGDLPIMLEETPDEMTPGERAILDRLDGVEERISGLETESKEDRLESIPQVAGEEKVDGRFLMSSVGGFLYVAPIDYVGPICTVCHMPPLKECRGGVVGLDPESRDIQFDPGGPAGSFVACKQKREWRDQWEPRPALSSSATTAPEQQEVESSISESATNPEPGES